MESGDQLPHAGDFVVRATERTRRGYKLASDFLDRGRLHFHERAAEHIRAARGEPGEGFADLEDVFLVGDDAEGRAQARCEARMRVFHRLQALRTTGELRLLRAIRRAGANH